MSRKITHCYLVIGDGWVYPGRSLHPSRRLLEHLAGNCKTTALRIAADGSPPIMVPMEEYDFDLDDENASNGEAKLLNDILLGKYIPEDHEVVYAVYPYYSKGAHIRGLSVMHAPAAKKKADETNRINSTGIYDPGVRRAAAVAAHSPEAIAKRVATMRRNGLGAFDPRIRATAHAPEARAKATSTMLKNGTGIFSLEAKAKAAETNRGLGWANIHKALHVRWHINRDIVNPDCEWCKF